MSEQQPMVIRAGALSMQVCVPGDWTDEQVKAFADKENVCGTENGWFVRNTGKRDPNYKARVACADVVIRPGFVHIMLDA